MDREERIRRRAHEIWERAGRPHGRDQEHWMQATYEVAAEIAAEKGTVPEGTVDAEAATHGLRTRTADQGAGRLGRVEGNIAEAAAEIAAVVAGTAAAAAKAAVEEAAAPKRPRRRKVQGAEPAEEGERKPEAICVGAPRTRRQAATRVPADIATADKGSRRGRREPR